MQPITYHVKESRLFLVKGTFLTLSIFLVAASLLFSVLFFFSEGDVDFGQIALFALLLAVVIPWTARVIRHSSRAGNFLRLDDDGLTLGSLGKIYHLAWPELSSFEILGTEKIWFLTTDHYVPIVKSGATRRDRFLLALRLGLSSTIRDHYDTPIEEIAATLNAYRERALGGGD